MPNRNSSSGSQVADTEPTLPELSPEEREATSFWFRRLATTLVLANGAGIIAMGGFVSNSDDLRTAATISYGGLSYFASGAFCAFISYILTLLFVAFRMDANGELEITRAEWRKSKNLPEKPSVAFGAAAVFFVFGQLGALISAALFFYFGSVQVITGLGQVACLADHGLQYCARPVSVFFPSVRSAAESGVAPNISIASGGDGAAALTTAGLMINIEKGELRTDVGGAVSLPQRISVAASVGPEVEISSHGQYLRLNVTDIGPSDECWLKVQDFYVGQGSPLERNPAVDALLRRHGRVLGDGNLLVSLGPTELTTKTRVAGQAERVELFRIYPNGRTLSGMEAAPDPNATTALTYGSKSGRLIVFSTGKKLDEACARIASKLGFLISR